MIHRTKRYLLYPLFVIALHGSYPCCAQQQAMDTTAKYDFQPRSTVIFEDDFSANKAGAFPKHWRMTAHCDDGRLYFESKYCRVQKRKDTTALVITPVLNGGLENHIQPDLEKDIYLPDSFTLEYDFLLETQNALSALVFNSGLKCLDQAFEIYSTNEEHLIFSFRGWVGVDAHPYKYKKTLTGISTVAGWHHFALSYDKKILKCYVDSSPVFNSADCGYRPIRFMFTSNKGYGNARYTNVRLAGGRYTTQQELENFNKLLTEKKLVTQAILFDVNSAAIKPESMDYINGLASFLRKNKNLKIEIDGHTDSTGTEAANKLLSQKRAMEIKRQLVLSGITTSRLEAKGFGSSQPIAPNTTEEGKATNRRVELKVISS